MTTIRYELNPMYCRGFHVEHESDSPHRRRSHIALDYPFLPERCYAAVVKEFHPFPSQKDKRNLIYAHDRTIDTGNKFLIATLIVPQDSGWLIQSVDLGHMRVNIDWVRRTPENLKQLTGTFDL